MKILLHTYRVYTSKNGYGFTPFKKAAEYPILIHDFPQKNKTTKIYFGQLPEIIKNVITTNHILNKQTISALAGEVSHSIKGDDLIEIAIKAQAGKNIIKDRHWVTTIEIITPIEIDDYFITHPESKHFWLDISKTYELWETNKSDSQSAIDYIISFITPEIGEDNLGDILETHFYITSENKNLGFVTDKEPLMILESYFHYDLEKLDLKKIKETLEKIRFIDKKTKGFITNVQHWCINTINEKDAWKLFLWSFWGIEVLSKKYGKDNYDELINKIQSISAAPLPVGINANIMETLIPEKGRTTLKADFAIMVSKLSPDTAGKDLQDFHESLKIRNNISHGEPISENQLPTVKTKMLFHKYYKLAIQDMLNGENS